MNWKQITTEKGPFIIKCTPLTEKKVVFKTKLKERKGRKDKKRDILFALPGGRGAADAAFGEAVPTY